MDRVVIGSVVQVHILKQYHRYSSLLPATATTMTAVPAVEAFTATIGHQDRAATATTATTTPTTSTFTAAMSICTTSPVRAGTLSVASRNNNKSLRSVDLEFPLIYLAQSLSAPRQINLVSA